MLHKEEYLKNPCGMLSIPYWKYKSLDLPENIKIIHQNDYHDGCSSGYIDEPYFRLLHTLENIEVVSLENFYVKTAASTDIALMADIISETSNVRQIKIITNIS